MSRTIFRTTLLLGLLAAAGCEGSELEDLEGRWTGTIVCFGDTSDITVGFQVDGPSLSGVAHTRTQGNNSKWNVDGRRAARCEEDRCQERKECPLGVNVGDASATQLRACESGQCAGCRPDWLPILITFEDVNVQLPNPSLKLWRYSPTALRGTIRSFCPDEQAMLPEVSLFHD